MCTTKLGYNLHAVMNNVAVTMLYCSLRSLLCSRKVIAPYCLSLFGPLNPDLIQTNKRTSSETANQN